MDGWDEVCGVEQLWEQMKEGMIDIAREMCGSVKVGRKNLKNKWWNDRESK